MTFRSFGDIVDQPTERPPSLVGGGLLDVGAKVIIGGPEKAGKSLLATQLAVCLASGQNWLGFKVYQAVPVLYIQLEISQYRLEERLIRQAGEHGSNIKEMLYSYTDFGFDLVSTTNQTKLFSLLHRSKAKVLILDPLYFLHNLDPNSEPDMAQLTRKLNNLLNYVEGLVVVAHHSKDTQDLRARRPGQRISGSAVLTRWPDSIITLESRNPNIEARLSFTLRNAEPPNTMTLRLDSNWRFREEYIHVDNDGTTADQYAEEVEITVSQARKLLSKHVKDGRLTQVESAGVTKYFQRE